MQTRSSSRLTRDQSSNPTSSTNTTPKGRNRRSSKQRVESSNLEEHLPPVVTMAANRTMAELLRAPTEGYAEVIVVPLILAEQFELKYSLINMMTTDQFFGLEMDNLHDHIRWGSPPVVGLKLLLILVIFLLLAFGVDACNVSAVRLKLKLLKNIAAADTNFGTLLQLSIQMMSLGVVCLPNKAIFAGLAQMGYEKPSTKLTFYKDFFSSQWKFLIHTILQSLSAKRTSSNEFSSAIASAVICLSTGQKFNFSKYIFDSLVSNVDSSSKVYMYPRFIQLIFQNQIGDLSTHTTKYISPDLTQKVFTNMRRVGKGFSGVETPLFEGMLAVREIIEEGITEEQVQVDDAIAAVQEHGADFPTHLIQQVLDTCVALTRRVDNLEHDKAAQKLEIIKLQARVKKLEKANKIKSSKLRHLKKVRTSQRIKSFDDMEDVFNQGRMIADLDKDEGIELVDEQVKDTAKVEGRQTDKQTDKQAEIYHLDMDHPSKVLISAASVTISAAKPSIHVAALTVVAAYTRRKKGVIIRDPEEELSSKTPAETPTDAKLKDKGKGILIEKPKPMKKKDQIELDAKYARKLHEDDHVRQKSKEDQYIKRYQVMKKRPQTKSEARKNMMVYLKNTVGYKLDFFKGMSYDDIRPIFQARFDANMRFLLKTREEMEEEDRKALQSINETPAQKATKRRKLNEEAKEVEDLKKHLEVVHDDDDDDVFTEAIPLARKLLELMLSKNLKKNTKCVNVAGEELTTAKHKLMLLVYCC
nr:hypothetical protein [Tanacetum cinerariifolium]